jgi:hypothetical protein
MSEALAMLRDQCGVLTRTWLPYGTMLPPLAAVWTEVESARGPSIGATRLKRQRWFWCASFEGRYESAANSKADADVPSLRAWLAGGEQPLVVRGFAFNAENWLDVTVRQRALYTATIALTARHRPLDFHQAVPLDRAIIESTAVDDHHVFPSAYLKERGITNYADTVLNHTLIDKLTNIRIGKKAPSVYIAEMRRELGSRIDDILRSHSLPPEPNGPLLTDNYEAFLRWRMGYLDKELRQVTSSPT